MRYEISEEVFENSIKQLLSIGFIYIKDPFIFSWEPYLHNVVAKQYHEIDNDRNGIIEYLIQDKNIEVLFRMADYLFRNNESSKSLSLCQDMADKLLNYLNDKEKAELYEVWGSSLFLSNWSVNEGINQEVINKVNDLYLKASHYNAKNNTLYENWGFIIHLYAAFINGNESPNLKLRYYEEANKIYELGFQINYRSSTLLAKWSALLLSIGNYTQEIDHFRKALKLSSLAIKINKDEDAYMTLSDSLIYFYESNKKIHLVNKAESFLNQSIARGLAIAEAYETLGYIYLTCKNKIEKNKKTKC